jgi:polysaccharide deacetylase family protein (PEP-CTERM system associated)
VKQNVSNNVTHVLTVDVEEYFTVEAFSRYVKREEWERYPHRVVENTDRLLKILDKYEIRGTFFVLGWIAERYPGLVDEIHTRGHEVASHGYDHRMITALSREDFRADIRRSKKILENITGSVVDGYRAPTFSIVKETSWAYEILIEEGYRYSSSVYPIWHDRYGWPSFGYSPRKVTERDGIDLWEIPMSVWKCGPLKIPFGGGGYLRAYPLFLTKLLFRNIVSNGRPGIVYIHPWELDDKHPSVRASYLARKRHLQGISGMERKLDRILINFPFDTMSNFLVCHRERSDHACKPDGPGLKEFPREQGQQNRDSIC